MLEKQRQHRILEELQKHGYITVKDMMVLLDTSRSSITRDLISMEKKGLLIREHGGASLKSISMNKTLEESTRNKGEIHVYEKNALCLEALKYIHDGNTIYIDSGTTVSYLVQYLSSYSITIVTSSIYLLKELPDNFKPQIIVLGGIYHPKYDMNYDIDTYKQLENMKFDKAYFSTNGIDFISKDVTLVDRELASIKKSVLSHSKESYLLVDSSKCHIESSYKWANIEDFTKVLLDSYSGSDLPENIEVLSAHHK